MSDFGKKLRMYRNNTRDPERGGALTQARFMELLGLANAQFAYSGSEMLSLWENGRRKISIENRPLLIAIIQVLVDCRGITSVEEANDLLAAGRYDRLDSAETTQLSLSNNETLTESTEGTETRTEPKTTKTNNQTVRSIHIGSNTGPMHFGSGSINNYGTMHSGSGSINVGANDSLSMYVQGVHRLLVRIESTRPVYLELLTYQQQISENVDTVRRYGDTPTNKAQRAEIIAQLNRVSLQTIGQSFNSLCR